MLQAMLQRIGEKLARDTVTFVAACYLVLGSAMVVIAFVGAKDRVTPFGTALMPDFAAMYVAGRILNEYPSDRLYDFSLQEETRRSELPRTAAGDRLPYVYAPWFALLWKPFARMSYEKAAASWLVASLGVMAAGFACLWRACPEIPGVDRRTAAMVALSFEPFLFECWANGQVSSFPFLVVCAALMLQRQGRPVASGAVLALLTYKPLQPPLLYLMLVVGAQWRTLGGVALGGILLGLVSSIAFGTDILVEYPRSLLEYDQLASSAGGTTRRLGKYTDMQHAMLLSGVPVPVRGLGLIFSALLFARLARLWRTVSTRWDSSQRHAWAALLALMPVLSLFFAVYDSIMAIPAAALTAAGFVDGPDRRPATTGLSLPTSFLGVLALVYLAGVAVPVFDALKINLLTIALLVFGWYVSSGAPPPHGSATRWVPRESE